MRVEHLLRLLAIQYIEPTSRSRACNPHGGRTFRPQTGRAVDRLERPQPCVKGRGEQEHVANGATGWAHHQAILSTHGLVPPGLDGLQPCRYPADHALPFRLTELRFWPGPSEKSRGIGGDRRGWCDQG